MAVMQSNSELASTSTFTPRAFAIASRRSLLGFLYPISYLRINAASHPIFSASVAMVMFLAFLILLIFSPTVTVFSSYAKKGYDESLKYMITHSFP